MSRVRTVPQLADAKILADIERGRGTRWIHTALRTRNPSILELLARTLTAGAMSATRLRDDLLIGSSPRIRSTHAPVAAALGTIWAASGAGHDEAVAGQRLLRSVAADAPSVLTPRQQQIYAQVSFLTGNGVDVADALANFPAIPAKVAESLRTDLLNPLMAGHERRTEWLGRLAAPFTAEGLAPITVTGTQRFFDGLDGATVRECDGPLVTVLMPCYRPDVGLLTSLRSIAAQSYRNIEILLVDDASGPEFEHLFDQAVQLDTRVKLLRLDRNGGTYRCRNAALEIARGTYVTVQDADDWSHPERLAEQVRLLEKTPTAGGSCSDAIRATDDLMHQWVGYSPQRRNASSLMFRRDIVERVGPFDLVRKSGDSEYQERLTRIVGPIVDTRTPLAVTRLRAGTLSRGDFSFQWMAHDRLMYRSAYRSWHLTLEGSTRGPVSGTGERAFPAPDAFLRDLPGHRVQPNYDLLLLLDGSDPLAATEALQIAHAGGVIGAIHCEDATQGRGNRPELSDDLLTASRGGVLELLAPSVAVRTRTMVVLSGGVLELLQRPVPDVRAAEIVVVARRPTRRREVQDHITVLRTCEEVYGTRPIWAAASPQDRAAWALDGWVMPLLDEVLAESEPADKEQESE